MNALRKITIDGQEYFIDFRLRELRSVANEGKLSFFPFAQLPEEIKAKIRGIRFRETSYNYIPGLDD